MINQLPEKLKTDIIEYCKLNNIDDINSFIVKLIKQSLLIEMYGREPEIIKNKSPEVIVEEITSPQIIEEVKVEILKEDNIVIDEKLKNEYKIDLDLNKKPKPPEPKIIVTPPPQDDDIYGEGKTGWFGGSNIYDLIKKKK